MKTNRLSNEKSPYLLQHQYNPVDWYPWGDEAFQKARSENKLIFLSIGYSTCHWCHVMERESFENEEVAALLNADYVSIKVDREERPDIDRVYMTFVQATTGSGGWPMSVFLTPDLNPLLGGTYFPPVDKWGKPGFSTVLRRLAEAWKQDRGRLLAHSYEAALNLQEYAIPPAIFGENSPLQPSLLKAGYDQIAYTYEPEYGGFSEAPKFPRPVTLNFLFRFAHTAPLESAIKARSMALNTLKQMARGGMYDQLGGGFHRYSVDRFWHVPHYEKMLYDQAQLACSYLDAYQITGDPFYAGVANGILQYVQRDMTSPEGGFYSAEDADSYPAPGASEKLEGAFYVWADEEIDAALPPTDAYIFKKYYGVTSNGNSPEGSDPHGELAGKNTLIVRYANLADLAVELNVPLHEVEESLTRCRAILLELRNQRPRPHLDDKILTAWNGLMISAFAKAACVLPEHRESYLASARNAADFVLRELCNGEHQLLRCYREGPSQTRGFCDDYAFFIQGLIDLYEATGAIGYLETAQALQETQDRLFYDTKNGGYYSTERDAPNLILRVKDDYDGAEPSANSVSILNLLRLSELLQHESYRLQANKSLTAFTTQLARIPNAIPQMLVALDLALAKPAQVILLGKNSQTLLETLHRTFQPHLGILHIQDDSQKEWLGTLHPILQNLPQPDDTAAAYLCRDLACHAPATTPEALAELLHG